MYYSHIYIYIFNVKFYWLKVIELITFINMYFHLKEHFVSYVPEYWSLEQG